MKVNLQSVHFSVDYKLREYLEQKISKLEQFFNKIIDVQVYLKLENAGQVKDKVVEIKLNLPGRSILIKQIAQSFEAGIDLATEVLKRQLVRFKQKQNKV
jgi:putative sigma-54 modulation protein